MFIPCNVLSFNWLVFNFSVIYVIKSVTICCVGYGSEKGGITALVYNHYNSSLTIAYLDIVPWFLRVYMHSLTLDQFAVSDDRFTTAQTVTPSECSVAVTTVLSTRLYIKLYKLQFIVDYICAFLYVFSVK